jgi:hypothetical protein
VAAQSAGQSGKLGTQFRVHDVTVILAINLRQASKVFAPVVGNTFRIAQPGFVEGLKVGAVPAIEQRCLLQCLHPLLAHVRWLLPGRKSHVTEGR